MGNYIAIRSGATALPEGSVARLTQDLVTISGVVNKLTHWAVTESNPKARSVSVAIGAGFFYGTSMTYEGFSDAANAVTVTANSSGNPRIDTIVAYVDKAAAADATASNVLKFICVAGTPAASPTAPSGATIQTAVGAGNPYLVLADVACANGYATLANADITDTRVDATFSFAKLHSKPNVLSYSPAGGSTQAIDLSTLATNGDIYITMPSGNITLNMTGGVTGQKFALIILQDGTGSRTTTFTQTIKWPDAVQPTNSGANKIDTYAFRVVDSSNFLGYIAGQNQ